MRLLQLKNGVFIFLRLYFCYVMYSHSVFFSNRTCFLCDRSDDADVTRTPFSLPLSLTRRWSATQSVNPSHFPSFSPALWKCVSFPQIQHTIPGSDPSCRQPLLLHPSTFIWPPVFTTGAPSPAVCLERCMAFWDWQTPWCAVWSCCWRYRVTFIYLFIFYPNLDHFTF